METLSASESHGERVYAEYMLKKLKEAVLNDPDYSPDRFEHISRQYSM